jgi:Zn finger protein HypA/HybF involved in hydrogenase expression
MAIAEGLAEIGSALGALQTAENILNTFKSLGSDKERSAKLIELNRQIMATQTSAIQANAAQTALIERIRELEKTIADFETWDTEKQRYELKAIASGSFVYALKADAQVSEPVHYICQTCYENRKKRVLQRKPTNTASISLGKPSMYVCPECKSEIVG